MGAQRASWLAGFRAETAAQNKRSFAQTLLDLVKAFEKVKHGILVAAAVRHGYNLWLLRMALASYRSPRAIGVGGIYTRLMVAFCGITAGSTFATTELRVLLLSMVDEAYTRWATVDFSFYVDDGTVSASGDELSAVVAVAGATDFVVQYCEEELGLEISVKKSVAAASTMTLARLVVRASSSGKLTAVRAAKLLGAPSGGGRRRYVRPSRARLKTLKARVGRIHKLRGASKVCIRNLVRASATPTVTYGVEVMGMSDSHLDAARSLVAKAVAPSAGGKSHHAVLYAVDAAGSSVDPAIDAHVLPIKFWSLARWQCWVAHDELDDAFVRAVLRLQQARRSCWDLTTGPVAALVASCWRIGWRLLSPTRFLTDEARVVDFDLDPPAAVAKLARRSVRRWQLLQVVKDNPAMLPSDYDVAECPGLVPDDAAGPFEPPPIWSLHHSQARLPTSVQDYTATLGKVLFSARPAKRLVPAYGFVHRPYLLSAITNGQWTQDRIAKAARTDVDLRCQLCFAEPGTLLHRRSCQAVVPHDGWPALPADAQDILDDLDPARRHLLLTKALFVSKLPPKAGSPHGWLRWLRPVPPDYRGTGTWYIDGSLMDGPDVLTARCGFAMALVSDTGDLLATAHGAPPPWVDSAAASEAWAYLNVLQTCPETPAVVTDCEAILTTVAAGRRSACAASRPLARIWKMVFNILDDDTGQQARSRLIWMPSHTSLATARTRRRSDGKPVSTTDWRANRLVDALAKLGATSNRASADLRRHRLAARQLVEHTAAVLGVATHGANHFREQIWTQTGRLVQTTRRDSAPPLLRKGLWGPRAREADAPSPAGSTPPTREDPSAAAKAAERQQAEDQLAAQRRLAQTAKNRAAEQARGNAAQAELRFKAAWHAQLRERALQPAAGPTASERLAALKARLQQRLEARL